ncbi:MAG: tryptophan--tRNA ligase [Methanobacteriota archaeon]|jgi:tryptophanyl-tRNA synthetase|nr:MAG: tryptophan--tRNA ligase [Euryarchaeota archaeon]HIG20591.1 tryptophan--tRNA ligase [Candidatus Poseidoniales archaeon]
MAGDVSIDPWSSSQSTDYARIIQQFGLETVDYSILPNPHMLHRRGIVFAHRDLNLILDAHSSGNPFGVLTGLMPSGRMHLGHKMVIDQVKWFQEQGADVSIAVADLEAHATRGLSLDECRRVALEEYVANYAALGLDVENTSVYFQSTRPVVQRLGFTLGKRTNLSEFEAIYGFKGETNLAHVQAPLVQAGDILHPQLDEYGGLRPIVVPVGVDQDPHLRLTRGLAGKTNWFNVNTRKSGGLVIGLSVQNENSQALGIGADGRIDKGVRQSVFGKLSAILGDIGFSDIRANPKHGSIEIPAATSRDRDLIRPELLKLERSLGGLGLLQPSSTYHKFAIGMTGDKMSSSRPETTIFLTEDVQTMEKKVKSSFSGGQSTLEEHRRLGGDPDVDVAFQYLRYFFEDDDDALAEVETGYRSGEILTGQMKQICIDKASEYLSHLGEMRQQTAHIVDDFLAADARL